MSEQNTAFENWYELHGDGSSYHLCKLAWNAATAEANKRVKELESEVAGLRFECASKDLHTDTLLEQLEEARISNTELQATNHDLREAFNDLAAIVNRGSPSCQKGVVDKCKCTTCVIDRGSATPVESLQALENEVIERCAKVCDEDAQESRLFGESFQSNVATILAESIRALKEVK